MKLRFLVLALAMAVPSLAAHSQVGLYFNPVVSRISNSTADTGTFAFLGSGDKSQIFGGLDFGGYYEGIHQPKFDLSLDVRDTIQHGNSASLNSFLVGVRLSAHPMAFGFKPYGQLSVGAGRTKSPYNPVHIEKLEYDIFGGIDKPLTKHVDFRMIEIGYGSVTTISSAIFQSSAPIPAARLLNFSTGFVFRFGGKEQK